jgi:hypothetical protein
MKRLMLIGLILFAANSQAALVTIDFEELSAPTSPTFTSNGFTFSNTAFLTGPGQGAYAYVEADSAGNQSLKLETSGFCEFNCATSAVKMTRVDGGAFSLLGFDADWECQWAYDCYGIVSGKKADGGTATGLIGSGDWLYLTEVTFFTYGVDPSGNYMGSLLEVDNIVVQAVPIPAAAWLLSAALGCLGLCRRIKTTRK